uniref:Uncharacterized protein n=1 Tax=Chaetoceros debilis TaxID=122233 RepID=A0A7S3Q4W8_9STRA|eukprot:CAMPEP_0194075188 /NCGR_PEP_ID=MMETSP0149-20130528/2209_1 /TAXON_ID=122233 /ORGANISM="Chaetoceros debilis, Strain MM31A-1" /LENGTH=127 /DNA_ID=CAMNT_0038755569 /DNA_START=38 /DNA_END=421 /DNA_ORIENTATION=+
MKISAAIILSSISGATAFTSLSQSRRSTSLNNGWDDYYNAAPAPAAPAAPVYAPPPAAPAAPAYVPPPAAPAAAAPAAPVVEEDEPMSAAWAAKVDYDPATDVFPVFPAHYRSFNEIWAEFQASKAN